jgi:hypothetical protein
MNDVSSTAYLQTIRAHDELGRMRKEAALAYILVDVLTQVGWRD